MVFGSEFLEKFHQIVWVSGSDFHLPVAPGVKKPIGITENTEFSAEFHKTSEEFLKISKFVEFAKMHSWFFVFFLFFVFRFDDDGDDVW